jgi:hypothetical protein
VDTALHFSVDDPSLYSPTDRIFLFPGVDDDGNYVPGSGAAFWIDGLSIDGRQSPFPQLTKIFGGVLEIKRVS